MTTPSSKWPPHIGGGHFEIKEAITSLNVLTIMQLVKILKPVSHYRTMSSLCGFCFTSMAITEKNECIN